MASVTNFVPSIAIVTGRLGAGREEAQRRPRDGGDESITGVDVTEVDS